jgi:hypothetical protein
VVECVSGEIGDITDNFATGTADELAFGLQKGTYCEVHDEPVPTNTMVWRTHEVIAL